MGKPTPLGALPKILPGFKRFYYRCTICKQVQVHECIPFGLGHGIHWNSCHCQLVHVGTHYLKRITKKEAHLTKRP